ncbi:Peptidase family M1 [Streptomyces sp. DvalAA-14]|uniref:M1 family metallopeptidase n=1 Tax=unclassified Streptomyces TaxID=2593676 RepID=UPI00081B0BF5|nr:MULTISPECIES: M1 family metallopeptidase [unclassified Streptomyces]MYS23110.1 M1 family peptidase [Streptomyces sp. SID4948]SCE27576.1 Peptidase family M1 [Streptomyces sp. DvalAA-14]
MRLPAVRTPLRAALPLLLGCCLSCSGGAGAVPSALPGFPAGVPGAGDRLFPRAGNGGYDVTHYGLDLRYDPGPGELTGTARISATATADLGRLDLDLAGLTVHRVAVDGKPAGQGRDGTELVVRPPRPITRGARFEITVRYSGVPKLLTDPDGSHEGWFRTGDGAVALGEPVGSMAWFPGNDHPSDKATYDITVSVPAGLTVVSNGELAGRSSAGGRTAFHWRTTEPMATYLATVAIGHYTVTRSRTPGGLPLYVAVDPRSDDPGTAAALRRIPEILAWESGVFGPYPFASAGAIVARLPTGRGGYALETQNRPVFPGDDGPPAVAVGTLVHELSHQWFGDWTTPADWQDIWLNEGFATYAEWLWQQHEGGRSVARSAASAFADPADWAFPPASPTAAHLFDAPVYDRGALVLYELHRALGDRAFATLLRTWPAAHRGGNASTAEFTAFCAHLTGKDLTPLFATWLYGKAKPARL